MQDAVPRVAYSGLGAANVLAAPAAAVRDTVARVAFSTLEAALVLAPPAPPPPCTRQCPVSRTWSSPPSGSACRLHAPRSTPCRLELALHSPPPHTAACPWPSSRLSTVRRNPNSAQCSQSLSRNHLPVNPFLNSRNPNSLRRHSQPSPTHLSALNLVHIGHQTHDGGSARAGQTLQHVSVKMVNSAWAGDVRWVCSRG
jgi:hypothetical protein